MFYLRTLLRTVDRETASQIAVIQKGKRGARMSLNFFCLEKNVVKHQEITANHKEQTCQVNDFSAFLCVGKCKTLGSFDISP